MKMRHSFSVIMPVLNEPSLINSAIEHVFLIGSNADLELIVVDGDAEGSTIHKIKDRGVRKLISAKGRGTQMNHGASVARGDILLFLHTDTELPEDAFNTISSLMTNDTHIGGAFDLGIRSAKVIFRLIEKMVYIRTRLTRIPYGDQGIFIKKNFFQKIDGYREIPLMEDVELMKRIKGSGYKIQIIPQQIKTSPRRWEEEGVIYCTLRNWMLISLYLLGVKPQRLAKLYDRNLAIH